MGEKMLFNITQTKADRMAVIEDNGLTHTYMQLHDDIENFSSRIKLTNKQLILVLAQNNYQTLISYLSVLHNQDAVMLLNADLEKTLLYTIIDTYQPAFIIGEIEHADYLSVENGILKKMVEPSYSIHSDLALLLSTSGTTGSVKFVRLSYRNLEANAKSIADYLKLSHEDRGLANLPMHYSYGLSVINSHLYAGATVLLTDESVLTKKFWEFVKSERANSIPGVPYTYQMLHRIGLHKMELPHLRYLTQAGGRLSEKQVQFFAQYAKETGKDFFVMYGQTEATARISYLSPSKVLEKPGSIGKAIPNGKLLIDSKTSELIYEGPNVMLGYAENYEDLARGDELQGILHTGDIAEKDEDGFFYIKGRMKRFIKLFGLRLNLDDIEKQIETSLQTNAVCVGSDDKMLVVIQAEEQSAKVLGLIERFYKLHRSSFRVKVLGEIPRLANGKVNYEELKSML